MNGARRVLRFLVLAAVSAAILAAPVVGAFAANAPLPPRAGAIVPSRGKGAPARSAHRQPRVRRTRRRVSVFPPSSAPKADAPRRSRRAVLSGGRSARADAFAALPDHPPA